jgi:hypothetical protein
MLYGGLEVVIDREDFREIECGIKQEPGVVEGIRYMDNVSTPHIDGESWIRDSFTRDPSVDHVTYPGHGFTWDY